MALVNALQPIAFSSQLVVCLGLIALIGIPHGAIDHIIYSEGRKKTSIPIFIGMYLVTILGYSICWYFLPVLSLCFFLILSAYHFGQSQFSDVTSSWKWIDRILYFAWGVAVLSALIVFNHNEIIEISALSEDMQVMMPLFDWDLHFILCLCGFGITLAILSFHLHQNIIESHRFFKEIYFLGLILLAFYIFPFLIGFTMYFVILHSLEVMDHEYSFLKKKGVVKSIADFVKLIVPLSLASYAGMAILIYLVVLGIFDISYPLLSFVIISLITLPHSFVMDDFYQRRNNKAVSN